MLGDYRYRFTRLIWTATTSTTSGERVPTEPYPEGVTYWGWLEYKQATEPVRAGAKRHVVQAEIHLHGFPDIDVKDRIRSELTGEVFEVTGLTYSLTDTILNAESVLA